ncbi:MAG: type VI secretion system contractile sheath large subunit [Pyrinomonadaceae bacterium]|nr:type VI secretion system contractile sheath large subunit [Pyrinomonadaceae bacterium]
MFPDDDNFESFVSLESEKVGIVEEIPFRILILGDWSGDGIKKELSSRSPVEIDRDNFDSVINRLHTKLELDLSLENDHIISLEFSELSDFHPDNIYRRVPLFADLRDLRRRLVNPDTFNSAAKDVRNWFIEDSKFESNQEIEKLKTVNSEDLLDQILSGKSENIKLQVPHNEELSSLLKDLVRPHLLNFDENEQKALISVVDEATGNLMRTILHHPKFQNLESAWRSLFFLVRNTETDSLLKIYVLDLTKHEIINKLKECNNLTDSEVYRKIVVDANETFGDKPWAAMFGNYTFQPGIDDIAALIRLSKIADTLQSPFISKIADTLLEVESMYLKPAFSDWNLSEDSITGKLWSTLRSLPESKFLGLTINRFLTRLPFGSKTDEIDSFSFEEFDEHSKHDSYVWGNSCFIVALLLANSFTKYGWQMGSHFEQEVEKLPIHIYSDGFETITKPCAEVNLTQTACERLLELGLMPLISFRDTDRIRLSRFQSVTKPVSALMGRWRDS